MLPQKQSKAKQVSIMAMVAALYAVLFWVINRYVTGIYASLASSYSTRRPASVVWLAGAHR